MIQYHTFKDAIKIMRDPTWQGKTIFAKNGTTEISIYKGIDMRTLKTTDQLFVDAIAYNEREFEMAKSALERAGFVIETAEPVRGSDNEIDFYNINAHS